MLRRSGLQESDGEDEGAEEWGKLGREERGRRRPAAKEEVEERNCRRVALPAYPSWLG